MHAFDGLASDADAVSVLTAMIRYRRITKSMAKDVLFPGRGFSEADAYSLYRTKYRSVVRAFEKLGQGPYSSDALGTAWAAYAAQVPTGGSGVNRELIQWLRNFYRRALEGAHGKFLDARVGSQTLHYPAGFFPANGQTLDRILPEDHVDLKRRLELPLEAFNPRPRRRRHNLPEDLGTDDPREVETTAGPNLCMSRMTLSEDLRPVLHALVDTYGRIMDSSDAMIDELIARSGSLHSLTPDQDLEGLDLRRRICKLDPNPFAGAEARAAGIGIAALVCYRRDSDGELYGIVGLRSTRVSTWQNVWHVFPSGMLGARWLKFGREYRAEDVRSAIQVEHMEELYSDESMEHDESPPEWAETLIRERLSSDVPVSIFFTGVAFDLLNLRPEICVLLLSPKDLTKSGLNPNWEIGRVGHSSGLVHVPVGTGRALEDYLDSYHDVTGRWIMHPEESVPSGAAAFWYGIRRLHEIEGISSDHGS